MESDGIGEMPHDLLLETYGAQWCVRDSSVFSYKEI